MQGHEPTGRKVCGLGARVTDYLERKFQQGDATLEAKAQNSGSKMTLGTSELLEEDLGLSVYMSSLWRSYWLPWVCSRGHVVQGGGGVGRR